MNQEKPKLIIMNGGYLKYCGDVAVQVVLGKYSTSDRHKTVSFSLFL